MQLLILTWISVIDDDDEEDDDDDDVASATLKKSKSGKNCTRLHLDDDGEPNIDDVEPVSFMVKGPFVRTRDVGTEFSAADSRKAELLDLKSLPKATSTPLKIEPGDTKVQMSLSLFDRP